MMYKIVTKYLFQDTVQGYYNTLDEAKKAYEMMKGRYLRQGYYEDISEVKNADEWVYSVTRVPIYNLNGEPTGMTDTIEIHLELGSKNPINPMAIPQPYNFIKHRRWIPPVGPVRHYLYPISPYVGVEVKRRIYLNPSVALSQGRNNVILADVPERDKRVYIDFKPVFGMSSVRPTLANVPYPTYPEAHDIFGSRESVYFSPASFYEGNHIPDFVQLVPASPHERPSDESKVYAGVEKYEHIYLGPFVTTARPHPISTYKGVEVVHRQFINLPSLINHRDRNVILADAPDVPVVTLRPVLGPRGVEYFEIADAYVGVELAPEHVHIDAKQATGKSDVRPIIASIVRNLPEYIHILPAQATGKSDVKPIINSFTRDLPEYVHIDAKVATGKSDVKPIINSFTRVLPEYIHIAVAPSFLHPQESASEYDGPEVPVITMRVIYGPRGVIYFSPASPYEKPEQDNVLNDVPECYVQLGDMLVKFSSNALISVSIKGKDYVYALTDASDSSKLEYTLLDVVDNCDAIEVPLSLDEYFDWVKSYQSEVEGVPHTLCRTSFDSDSIEGYKYKILSSVLAVD